MSTPQDESNAAPVEGQAATTVEDALKLLTQGKEFEKEKQFWKAIDAFLQGRQILETLAENQPRVTDQDRRIALLYDEKAREYLSHSRITLIEALKAEATNIPKQHNNDDDDEEHVVSSLSDDQAALRNRIFCTLFSKPIEVARLQPPERNIMDQQLSIEERLEELNASLPSGFKTDTERMDSINKGLNKLGLSLYTQKAPFASFQETIPKSEDEQINDIMAQVTDEIALEQQLGGGGSSSALNAAAISKVQHNDQDSDEESSEYDDPPEDLKLNDEQLAIKHIKRRVTKSQQELAMLVARLDAAHKAKDDETLDDTLSDDGEGYLRSGKKMLRQAQRQLQKALDEWNEELKC